MPRKRVVDPKFFKDWELYQAEQASGLPLRLGYEGLWAVADREGRFEWKPREIKLDVLPFDEVDFAAVLEALQVAGFVRHYEVENRGYGYIPNFKRYQPIHPREAASKIPAPPVEASLVPPDPVQGSPKASPGNGKDKPSPPASTSASTSTSTSEVVAAATNGAEPKPKSKKPARDPPALLTWVQEAVEIHDQHIGQLSHGKAGKVLKPLVDKRGWPEVKPVWEYFCEFAPYADYLARMEAGTLRAGEEKVKKFGYNTSPQSFVEHYTHWAEQATT